MKAVSFIAIACSLSIGVIHWLSRLTKKGCITAQDYAFAPSDCGWNMLYWPHISSIVVALIATTVTYGFKMSNKASVVWSLLAVSVVLIWV